MYLKYCLIANTAICLLSLILFFFMKKKNQTSKRNTTILVFCTALAMICATLTPLIANYLVKGLSFSIIISVIVSLVFVVTIALIIFYLILSKFFKQGEGNKEKADEIRADSIVERIIEDSAKAGYPVYEAVVQSNDSVNTNSTNIINEADYSIENEAQQYNKLSSVDSKQGEAVKATDFLSTEKLEDEKQEIPENMEFNKSVFIDVPVYNSDKQSDIFELLDRAAESKMNRNYKDAIAAYESALIFNPDDELRFLIILDLCSLYKLTENSGSIYKLLDSTQCNMLNEGRKEDILRNIQIS